MGVDFTEFPLRWIGYGIAFGEAARSLISQNAIEICNTVAGVFILAHTIMAGLAVGGSKALIMAIDTFIFEMLASALIPTFLVIHVVRIATDLAVRVSLPFELSRYIPPACGILTIHFCALFLDNFINDVMNQTLRTLY